MAGDGSDLRKLLEESLGRERALVAGQFKHVTVEDLAGVEPAKLRETAEQVEATRTEERKRIFEEMASEMGIDLNAKSTATTTVTSTDAGTAGRFASAGQLTGSPMRLPEPGEGKVGRARLEAVIEARNAKRAR